METLGGSEPASLHPKCTMEQEFSFTALVSDWGGGRVCVGMVCLMGQFSECWGKV